MTFGRKKIAFVVQRFGAEVVGGSEALARDLAIAMKDVWDITVVTTCAIDFRTWENHYPVGDTEISGVKVKRFPVDRPRDFEAFSGKSFARESTSFRSSPEEELKYFNEQGPFCPKLVDFLEKSYDYFDAFIFFTYLYYPSVFGIPKVAKKAYLVPTAHDESPFYFVRTFAPLYHSLRGIIFLSDKEMQLIDRVYEIPPHIKRIRAGYGVPGPVAITPEEEKDLSIKYSRLLEFPYFIFLGRATETKNCYQLLHAFGQMKDQYKIHSLLVFAGSMQITLPGTPDVIDLGEVTAKEKSFLLSNCRALVNPSSLESLSIVVLEAWAHGAPVIVNGVSDVMRENCDRSRGGVYYYSMHMHKGLMGWALTHPHECIQMGKQGRAYVELNYDWDSIRSRLSAAIT